MIFACRAIALGLFLFFIAAADKGIAETLPDAVSLRAAIEKPSASRSAIANQRIDWDLVANFYRKRNYRPAWFGFSNNERFDVALSQLNSAKADGLDPADYYAFDIGDLRKRLAPLDLEISLSSAMLRYTRDRNVGRRDIGFLDRDVEFPSRAFDAANILSDAVDQFGPKGVLSIPEPDYGDYRLLKTVLRRYLQIMRDGGWPETVGPVTLDKDDVRVASLLSRLKIEYPGAVEPVDAVKRFQEDHGLEIDGVVGPETLKALNVPVIERVDQIRANMERWRWVGALQPDSIRLNIPAAELALYRNNSLLLTSRVIVGKPANPTPLFTAAITGVVVNPPWDVPASIAKKEILPKVRRDPGYLAKHHFIVTENGDLRQLPGPDNSLGLVKLDMPNRFSTYLHDTPSRSLFALHRRFLSHGCMRVEKIREVAAFLLGGEQAERLEEIDAAIADGATRLWKLEQPMQVYVLYRTVIAKPDGSAIFLPDIYGRDARWADAVLASRNGQYVYSAKDGCD